MSAYRKFQKRGLVIIAMHRGSASGHAIMQVAHSHKWTFSVYDGGRVKGNDQNTNPQQFIFDYNGDLAFDSRYESGTEKALLKIAARAPDWLLRDKKFKKLGSLAKKVKARKDMGKVLIELAAKVQSQDADEKAEAEFLQERVKWFADWRNRKALEKIQGGHPAEGLQIFKELSKQYAGDAVGDKAKGEYEARKSDKKFKSELAAEKLAVKMERAYLSIKPRKPGEDDTKWQRRNARYIGSIRKSYLTIKKKYPDTLVFQRVTALVSDLGFG